jgi:hypothetical protein
MISATLFIVGVAAVGICVSILGTILFACTFSLVPSLNYELIFAPYPASPFAPYPASPNTFCTLLPVVILPPASILLPVLFFTSLLSLSILSFLLSLFLAQRLYVHLTTSSSNSPTGKADLRALSVGMRGWAEETASRAGVDYGKFDMPTVLGKWGGVNGYGSGEGKIVGIKKEGTKLELEVPAGVTVRAVGNDSGSEVMY